MAGDGEAALGQEQPEEDELRDLLEIRDPEVDSKKIVEEIRRRLQVRRQNHPQEVPFFPSFAGAIHASDRHDGNREAGLQYYLRLANASFANRATGPVLATSPATRSPVVGRLWRTIRGQAHALILFYVNRSIAEQVTIDRHIISTLNLLAEQVQDQQREIARLREQLNRWSLPLDG